MSARRNERHVRCCAWSRGSTLGEKDLAIAQYRRVLELFPAYSPAKRRLEALTGKAP
jgi:hypothetical protein